MPSVRSLVSRLGAAALRPWRAAAASNASGEGGWPADLTQADLAILRRAGPFTMTSVARQVALLEAVRYVIERGIAGDFVECGVWRGGSAMIIAMALAEAGVRDRDLHLFDTYDGMTPPTDLDRSLDGQSAREQLAAQSRDDAASIWCRASLDEVRANMSSTGYPPERIHLVRGPVERTIPEFAPAAISVLRLDTDWYESTRHELEHLFPRVSRNGVVIIDDYGHWQGARRAVDEYFREQRACHLMHRVDYTGRLLIKN
ncbi:MAG: TylF/MycF/NovP-related O-methyltransferase [Planctomycetia bacterium]